MWCFINKLYFFNNNKTKNIYIIPLLKILNKIYNKKVIFNIIKLKSFYFNSEILTQIITIPLEKIKTISKKNVYRKVAVQSKRFGLLSNDNNEKFLGVKSKKLIGIQNCIIKNELLMKHGKSMFIDNLNEILNKFLFIQNDNNFVLNRLRYKIVKGLKLKACGRLTKRFKAQKGITDIKYMGSIRDTYSSYKGLSTVMVRGRLKANILFSKQQSKTHVGAFGLKGWISTI